MRMDKLRAWLRVHRRSLLCWALSLLLAVLCAWYGSQGDMPLSTLVCAISCGAWLGAAIAWTRTENLTASLANRRPPP